jgi:uncharacterized Zn-binding protein involved in type VI secretion
MPEIARGDGTDSVSTNHGCDATTVTDECSGNVFVNNKGAVRQGDNTQTHLVQSGLICVPHRVPLTTYSGSVFVNGKGIGRKGDSYSGETITSGSSDCFAGD